MSYFKLFDYLVFLVFSKSTNKNSYVENSSNKNNFKIYFCLKILKLKSNKLFRLL